MSVRTKEDVLIAGAVSSWKSAIQRADKFFNGLEESNLYREIAPGRNRSIYLWGHLAAMHDRMLSLLGASPRVHPEFDAVFLTSPDTQAELPSVEILRDWWAEVCQKLDSAIDGFSASDWLDKHTAVSDEDFAKDPLRNRFSILISRTNHLSYHLGQTALVRD